MVLGQALGLAMVVLQQPVHAMVVNQWPVQKAKVRRLMLRLLVRMLWLGLPPEAFELRLLLMHMVVMRLLMPVLSMERSRPLHPARRGVSSGHPARRGASSLQVLHSQIILTVGRAGARRLQSFWTLSPPLLGWAAHARTAAQSSVAAHLLQSFWLLSEHWACAAELSKPVFLNTTFCE